jgi:capsular polysaccharide biosynthesis protein
MLKNKRIRIIIISTLVALVISALYMLGIISDEIKLYKLEATS